MNEAHALQNCATPVTPVIMPEVAQVIDGAV